ncbi:MAG: hypothetical protein WCJ02_03085 [bacterium]
MSISRKRFLKESNPGVFLGGGRTPHTFRLDVREDGAGRQEYFSRRVKPVFARQKLFHYISAGGMKQLRRTSADDLAVYRMQAFLACVAMGIAAWLFFYFLPSM